jgi:hypothetical protein
VSLCFWITKSIFQKTTLFLWDTILLFIIFWTICIRFTISDVRKPKILNANCMKNVDCKNIFFHIWPLYIKQFSTVSLIVKVSIHNAIKGETLGRRLAWASESCLSPVKMNLTLLDMLTNSSTVWIYHQQPFTTVMYRFFPFYFKSFNWVWLKYLSILRKKKN